MGHMEERMDAKRGFSLRCRDCYWCRKIRVAATRKEILPIMVVKKIKFPRFNGEDPKG